MVALERKTTERPRRFVVIEGDADHALRLMEAVICLGHAAFGPVRSSDAAVSAAGDGWDGALIGHLPGRIRPVTDALRTHGVPFAVLRDEDGGLDALPTCPDERTLRGVIHALAQHAGPPPPRRRVRVRGRHQLIVSALTDALAAAAPDCRFEADWQGETDGRDEGSTDLVLLHLGSQRLCGSWASDALAEAIGAMPTSGVAILCDHEDDADIARALAAGIRGYLPTSYDLGVTLSAIRLLLAGGVFVPATAARPGVTATPAETAPLSERQAQILGLIAEGKPNKIIAYELSLKEATVKMHVRHLMQKLGVTNRTQAAFVHSQALGQVDQAGSALVPAE